MLYTPHKVSIFWGPRKKSIFPDYIPQKIGIFFGCCLLLANGCWLEGDIDRRPGNSFGTLWESEFLVIMFLRIYVIFGVLKKAQSSSDDEFRFWKFEISRIFLTDLILFYCQFGCMRNLNKHDLQQYQYAWQNGKKSFQKIVFGSGTPRLYHYFQVWLTGTLPVNYSLLPGTVLVNYSLLKWTVPVNNFLLTGTFWTCK